MNQRGRDVDVIKSPVAPPIAELLCALRGTVERTDGEVDGYDWGHILQIEVTKGRDVLLRFQIPCTPVFYQNPNISVGTYTVTPTPKNTQ